MADVIDISTKFKSSSMKEEPSTLSILKDIFKAADSIEHLVIFIKTNDGSKLMFRTDASLEDRSLFVQLLQHDIYNDIDTLGVDASTEDL